MSSSSSPGDAVKVCVLEPLLDLVEQVPARGAIRNMVASRAAFVVSGVELSNDASFAVSRMPDEGARVSLSGEGLGILDTRVIDPELDRLDADFVESE